MVEITHNTPDIKDIRQSVALELSAVEALLSEHHSQIPLAQDITNHVTSSGGKRVRPLVFLLWAKHFGLEHDALLSTAAALELMHTATLLHDDVVDDSPMRRGQPTAKQIWGNAASVLIGDYLYALSFRFLTQSRHMDVIALAAEATQVIAEGEVLQLTYRGFLGMTLEQHLHVLGCKTGKLFGLSCEMAGAMANQDLETRQKLNHYGMQVGVGFQLIDDALDYVGDTETIGKRVGDDLADGSLTLPLIHALRNGSSAQKDLLETAIKARDTSKLADIQTIVRETGAIDYTQALAQDYIQQALGVLEHFEPTPYRKKLADFAEFVAARAY